MFAVAHGGKCSDQQSSDFRADFALQVFPVLQARGVKQQVMEKVMTLSVKEK